MSTNCTHFNHIPHQSRIPIPFFAGKDPPDSVELIAPTPLSDKEACDFALTDDLGSFCNNLSELTRSISEIVSQRHGEHASCHPGHRCYWIQFNGMTGFAHTAKSGHACVNPTPSASSIQHRTLLRSSLNGSTRQQCHVALNMLTDCPCFLEVPTPPP